MPARTAEPLSAQEKQDLAQQTGIPEIADMQISRIGTRTSANGGEIGVFTIDGANPFATADAVADAVQSFERIGRQNRSAATRVGTNLSGTVQANYIFKPVSATNHMMFLGSTGFLPHQDLPRTFANSAAPEVQGTSFIDEQGRHRDTASSFMGDASKTAPLPHNVNYALAVLNVEACQNTLFVTLTSDTMARMGVNNINAPAADGVRDIGQELVCNSYGSARAYKVSGVSYSTYQSDMQHAMFNLSGSSVPYIVVDEQTYTDL